MKNCLRLSVLIAAFAIGAAPLAVAQGAKPAPKTAKPPAKSAPAAKKPVAPAVVTPAIPPPPPPPSDVRFKTTYVNGEQTTTSATYVGENGERYELGDTILIRQKDHKRVVQISVATNTYLVTTIGATAAPPSAAPAAAAGVVLTTVAIIDMGERKTAFGHEARRVRTVIDRQPQPGACDQSKVRIETDGWYIDPPKALAATPAEAPSASAGCKDEIKATETGDPKLLAFPISYRTSFTEPESKDATPLVVAMDITEFEVLELDAALFEIPAGLTEAATARQLAKAISDANEVTLAAGAGDVVARQKQPGTLRVGVPEIANKTSQTIDTRAMRARMVAELEQQEIDVVPMAAAGQPDLDARAKALGVDYLLVAEITDLKTSKPGGITRFVKNTAGEGVDRDITEAKLNVQLVAPGGKPRLSKTTNGKDGGIGVKTGLGLAKFAGSMYLRMYMGGYASQLSALGAARMMNLGGMNPALMQMQTGLGATRFGGSGFDRTAGAALYVMQQTMAGASAGGESQGGPSFDAALENAIQDAGKEVVDSMKKVSAVRK
jgi:hypothetical protein